MVFGVISHDMTNHQVIVPKARNEILGVVIVESGWGSMLPTVVIANLAPAGAAARCGQLNIGDQIIAINGISLVGLPLSTCQTYIKVRLDRKNISLFQTKKLPLANQLATLYLELLVIQFVLF